MRTRRPPLPPAAGSAAPHPPRVHRLAGSIRLPWLAGSLVLLALSVGTALLVGRTGGAVQVPRAVLDAQVELTDGAAQSVRRAVNEGIDDLTQLAQTMEVVAPVPPDVLDAAVGRFATVHRRYASVYVVDEAGTVTASAGLTPRPDLLGGELPTVTGMRPARPVGEDPVIQQFAPMSGPGGSRAVAVAHYDAAFLRFSLDVARPGSAWVVTAQGRVIASLGGFTPFQTLPRPPLVRAAADAGRGERGFHLVEGSVDRSEVVAYAPVTGPGPAGQLGWSVVSTRSVDSISLPQTDARRQGVVAGGLLVLATLALAGWLYMIVYRPLGVLQREAERIAAGDLSGPVPVFRYDEIGVIARALERTRVALVRTKVGSAPGAGR